MLACQQTPSIVYDVNSCACSGLCHLLCAGCCLYSACSAELQTRHLYSISSTQTVSTALLHTHSCLHGNMYPPAKPSQLRTYTTTHPIQPHIMMTGNNGRMCSPANTTPAHATVVQHTLLCLQVGQVILTLPNAFSKTGLAAGIFFQLIFATVALWTLFLMATLYQEFKRRKAAWRRDLHHGIIMVTCT